MKKQIQGYENYFIYVNGDVVNTTTQKVLEGSIGEGGYKYYRLSKNGVKKMFYAHRLVATHFIDNPSNLPVVNHVDGDKLNNDKHNLEWVSYSDNMKHAYETGLIATRRKSEKYTEDFKNEYWKSIPNYSNYKVSNFGRVRSLNRNIVLSQSITAGYAKVRLSTKRVVEDIFLHHLVYRVFINDSDWNEGEVINHIDGNKLNNRQNNLRKISLSENVKSALYQTLTNKSIRAVEQYDLDMNFIRSFLSGRQAARELNLDSSTITKVCRGKNKTHGGFIFKYVE